MTLQSPYDKSFVNKLRNSGRSFVTFFGSNAGTGEEFAVRLAKDGVIYGLEGLVANPGDYDMKELVNLHTIENSLAVFFMATYGEGEPTDNAVEFYEWLHKNKEEQEIDLTGLKYAVFGLGNRTYPHYNEVAIYVDGRLKELGASRVLDIGLGDDNVNIEGDFLSWKTKFWSSVCELLSLHVHSTPAEEVHLRQYCLQEFKHNIPETLFNGEVKHFHSLQNQQPPFDDKNPFLAKIIANKELHKGGNRSCIHLEFDMTQSEMTYEAGDHLGVFPVNDKELVEKIGSLTQTNLDTVFSLINKDPESSKKHPFPCPTTYRTALTHYLNITMNPRRYILKELSKFCARAEETEILNLMTEVTLEGRNLYQQWIICDNRNIVDILEDLNSCKPPLDLLCELLPRLQPRYYSISSSPKLYPNTVHITAVVIEYDTPTGRHRKGVATTWLRSKPLSSRIPVFVRKSTFKLPENDEIPVILIGPGTGLAPLRGFIQERSFALDIGKSVGDTILYFGCRKRTEDFIYEDELREHDRKGALTKFYLACSRDQGERTYVQHLLQRNADEAWRIIGEKNGRVYLCGNGNTMAFDIRKTLTIILQEKGHMTESEAVAYLNEMEIRKRYQADVWSRSGRNLPT